MVARIVNVHEAKTHLSRLLRDVEAGQEIEIARDGKPIARIIPVHLLPRVLGGDEGLVTMAEDFNDLPEDLLEMFYTWEPST